MNSHLFAAYRLKYIESINYWVVGSLQMLLWSYPNRRNWKISYFSIAECSAPWKKIPRSGRCYLFSKDVGEGKRNQTAAKQYCQKQGEDLAIVGYLPDTEADPLVTYIKENGRLYWFYHAHKSDITRMSDTPLTMLLAQTLIYVISINNCHGLEPFRVRLSDILSKKWKNKSWIKYKYENCKVLLNCNMHLSFGRLYYLHF